MNKSLAITGNRGPKVRSDCEITLELTSVGGIIIELTSKVKALYGESIESLLMSVLRFFGIENALVKMCDSGALPFVIAARIEAAIKQLIETDLEYLPELIPENCYQTDRDRFRFARLYLPGNTPGLMLNAGLHSAEGIILDLEDSVAPEKKDEARILVRNALRQVNFSGAERMVRINQGLRGLEDLAFVIPHYVNLVLIPKCESSDYVRTVSDKIEDLKQRNSLNYSIFLMPIIETALGVENAYYIAQSCENVVAMALGLEDYTSDLGVPRTAEGTESFYVLSPVPNLNAKNIDWTKMAPIYKERILKFLEDNYLPDLRANIIAEHSIDPLHFQNTLNSYRGAAFSVEPVLTQSAWFRPHNRSEDFENLYFAGAGTHPGAGLPGVLSSSIIVENLIQEST